MGKKKRNKIELPEIGGIRECVLAGFIGMMFYAMTYIAMYQTFDIGMPIMFESGFTTFGLGWCGLSFGLMVYEYIAETINQKTSHSKS